MEPIGTLLLIAAVVLVLSVLVAHTLHIWHTLTHPPPLPDVLLFTQHDHLVVTAQQIASDGSKSTTDVDIYLDGAHGAAVPEEEEG